MSSLPYTVVTCSRTLKVLDRMSLAYLLCSTVPGTRSVLGLMASMSMPVPPTLFTMCEPVGNGTAAVTSAPAASITASTFVRSFVRVVTLAPNTRSLNMPPPGRSCVKSRRSAVILSSVVGPLS